LVADLVNLPGFSSQEQSKPPTKRELQAMERDYRALVTWYQTGDEGKVRDALKLPSKAAAKVAINRAVERWHEELGDHIGRVRGLHDHLLMKGLQELSVIVFEEGGKNLHRMKELVAIMERQTKLLGLDAQKEEAGGPQVVVIDSRPPWERGETIDGEADDDPPALPSST
jgi:hypothetical protein